MTRTNASRPRNCWAKIELQHRQLRLEIPGLRHKTHTLNTYGFSTTEVCVLTPDGYCVRHTFLRCTISVKTEVPAIALKHWTNYWAVQIANHLNWQIYSSECIADMTKTVYRNSTILSKSHASYLCSLSAWMISVHTQADSIIRGPTVHILLREGNTLNVNASITQVIWFLTCLQLSGCSDMVCLIQCFFFRRHLMYVNPEIIDFHYLKRIVSGSKYP